MSQQISIWIMDPKRGVCELVELDAEASDAYRRNRAFIVHALAGAESVLIANDTKDATDFVVDIAPRRVSWKASIREKLAAIKFRFWRRRQPVSGRIIGDPEKDPDVRRETWTHVED